MLSPRSAAYERLETGRGTGNVRQGMLRNLGWKKIALGITCFIGVVWVFQRNGNGREASPAGTGMDGGQGGWKAPDISHVDLDPLPGPSEPEPDYPTPAGNTPSRPQPPSSRPTSYETDPDHLGTVYCKAPYNPSSPLVQYALMIDAGSTGSRIHVYKFHNCGPSPAYEYEVFKMIKGGLSSYKGRPEEAAKTLDVLLDTAMQTVPESLRKCTPVQVKATAGLRLLGAEDSADILAAVRRRLHEEYPFPIADEDDQGVMIMDGKDEGVYAWITANYLLDTIRADSPVGAPTYAVLDLGGASTQIVFQPIFKQDDAVGLADGDHKYELKFGGKKHVLYQHSYLGYGLMRARESVHRLVEFMASIRTNKGGREEIGNPCLARGTKRMVELSGDEVSRPRNVTMVGEDVGGFEACNRIVQLVMAKDAICETKPCSFDGVYQPSILDTFPQGKILLLSYFYDRLQPLLPPTIPGSTQSQDPITVSSLASLAQTVCLGPSEWNQAFAGNPTALEELEGRPEHCLDLTFMHALLRLGYEFGDDRTVEIGKQIDGTELGWCLGAAIAMVGGELRCKA